MKNEDVAADPGLAGDDALWRPPDLPISGSPERSLERTVVEDRENHFWILERLDTRTVARKTEIAAALAILGGRLPEVKPYLAFAPGRYIAEREGGVWQVAPYVAGHTPRAARVRLRGLAGRGPGRPADPPSESRARYARPGRRRCLLPDRLRPRPHRKTEKPRTPASRPRLSGRPPSGARAVPEARPGPGRLQSRRFPSFEHDLVPDRDRRPYRLGVLRLPAGDIRRRAPCRLSGDGGPPLPSGDLVKSLVSRLRAGAGYSEAGWEAFRLGPGRPIRLAIRLAAPGGPGNGRPRSGLHRLAARK